MSLGHSAGWRQMVSYASFYLREGPQQRTPAEIEAALTERYPREPPEEIASAIAHGQLSAEASAAWEEGLGPQGTPLVEAGFPEDADVTVMFRVQFTDPQTGESSYRMFPVEALANWSEQELFEALEDVIEGGEEGYAEDLGAIAGVSIFSVF